MNRELSTPPPLQAVSRLLGWSLLVGGLAISLLANSISSFGTLSERLQDLGFPAGTLCVAGFLLLALESLKGREPEGSTSASRPASLDSLHGAHSKPGTPDLRKLENRLIAELDRRHELLWQELQGVSSLLEANLEAGSLSAMEWPMAAGAELSSHQLRPAPRGLEPLAHPSALPNEEEGLEVYVDFEEKEPDETLLWKQGDDLLESGDLEGRLTGEVVVDRQPFEWDFPAPHQSGHTDEPTEPSPEEPAAPESESAIDEEPQLDRENIQWFDWDDDDLV